MKLEVGKLHPIEEEPLESGHYLVLRIIEGDNRISYASQLEFVKGVGWNCFIDYKGNVHNQDRMFTKPEDEYYWTTIWVDDLEDRDEY